MMAEIRFEEVVEEWEEHTPSDSPYFFSRLMVVVMTAILGISLIVSALFGNR